MKKIIILREGFWDSEKELHFPMPIAQSKPRKGQSAFRKTRLISPRRGEAK